MDEVRVYIANLGKYAEGELVGAWFTLPVNEEEVIEKIGLNEQYEEYAIHDYESPYDISEHTSIEELNQTYEAYESIEDDFVKEHCGEIARYFSVGGLEELADCQSDIIVHSCDSESDLAYEYVEDGLFGEVPEHLVNYLDYEAIGRDIVLEGNFAEIGGYMVEYQR